MGQLDPALTQGDQVVGTHLSPMAWADFLKHSAVKKKNGCAPSQVAEGFVKSGNQLPRMAKPENIICRVIFYSIAPYHKIILNKHSRRDNHKYGRLNPTMNYIQFK